MKPTILELSGAILALSPFSMTFPVQTKPQADNLYETAVLLATARAAASVPGTWLDLHDSRCVSTTLMRFRDAPGRLGVAPDPYSHVCVRFSTGRHLQVHRGVSIRGRSGTWHEADIAAIHYGPAIGAAKGVLRGPGWQSLTFMLEAKCHSAPISLPLARAVVGLGSELSFSRVGFVASSGADPGAQSMFRGRRFACVETSFAPGATTGLQNSLSGLFLAFATGRRR